MQRFGGPGGDLAGALQWLAANPRPASIAAGSYRTTGVVDIPAGCDLVFQDATIVPGNPSLSALRLTGSGTKLSFLGKCRIGAPGTVNSRLGNAEAAGLELQGATNFDIEADALTIEGVAQAGVFVYRRSSNGTIRGSITSVNTGADSFHITDGSHDIDLSQATLSSLGSGDDGFAVVSYLSNEIPVRNVHWGTVVLRAQRWGRGVSVVGGQNVTVDHFDIDGSAGAGVYIAAESQYNTYGVSGVKMGGKVRNPNTRAIHNANVILYSGQPQEEIENATVLVDADPGWPVVLKKGSFPIVDVVVNGLEV